MLKLLPIFDVRSLILQPPSGGCVLKLAFSRSSAVGSLQPPSGGCVLKLRMNGRKHLSPSSHLRVAVC